MQLLKDVANFVHQCHDLGSEIVCKKRIPSLTPRIAPLEPCQVRAFKAVRSQTLEMKLYLSMSLQHTSSHVLLALERPTRTWKEDVPSRAGEHNQAFFRLRGTCSGDLGPGTTYGFCSLPFRRSLLAFSVREARNRPSGCLKFHIRDSEPLTRLPGETRLVSE
jgi:hypothetical protein